MKSSTIMILTITLASTYAFTNEQSDTIRRLMDLIDHVKGYDKVRNPNNCYNSSSQFTDEAHVDAILNE